MVGEAAAGFFPRLLFLSSTRLYVPYVPWKKEKKRKTKFNEIKSSFIAV